jgi:2-polyprenyl-3-methyl-5-hydroxy-6-metoxy-1,4-benzoquinol methylase
MTCVDGVAVGMASTMCALCGGAADQAETARDYITGDEFTVRKCRACGFGVTDALPRSLDAFYPHRYRKYTGLTRTLLKALYAFRVRGWRRWLRQRGVALEVGCGDGWMLASLRRRGWRVIGIERSIDAARSAAKVNQVPALVGGLDALRSLPQFDVVILFQVLEHLLDPLVTLRRAADLLAPDGTIIVAVPNLASWQARVFGRSWFHLDVPRHVNHFSPEALRLAFQHTGLRIVRMRFSSIEHDPFGWVQSALNAMGFKQNLLTKWLMGLDDEAARPVIVVAMATIGAILVVPSLLLASLSWAAGSGAIVEVWGVKA